MTRRRFDEHATDLKRSRSMIRDTFLGGGFIFFKFPPLPGEDSHFD